MKRHYSLVAIVLIAALSVCFSDSAIAARTGRNLHVPSPPGTQTPDSMLQLQAGGHIMGFQPGRVYLAALDHGLVVDFLGTPGVMPTMAADAADRSADAPAGRVIYENLWKGISLIYETTKDGLTESTYRIAPGADTTAIRLKYNVPVARQKDGSLQIRFAGGCLSESAPVAWQEIAGTRVAVKAAFKVSNGEIGFRLGSYDRRYPVTIDPVYKWHTFYGTLDGSTYAFAIATDGSGNVYVTGYATASWTGPANQAPLHAYSGGWNGTHDIFVLKLNSKGAYQWHTFYGSSSAYDEPYGMVTDTGGNVYVTGYSLAAWNGPANQAPVSAFGLYSECFVLKLSSAGAYQWHTFHGGASSNDGANSLAVDGNGNVYITGNSNAAWNGPAGQAPLQAYVGTSSNVFDFYVIKLNSSGLYQWHTFYGASGNDEAWGLTTDDNGYVYISGYTRSSWNGPAGQAPLHAFSGSSGIYDIFILKLNGSGAYQWHTFYGAANNGDTAADITVDGSGNVYIVGNSGASWNGPSGQTPLNAISNNAINRPDIFVLKLNHSGAYEWHTFHGGPNSEEYSYGGISLDKSGNIYVAGRCNGTWNGPSGQTPAHAYTADWDLFVLKLSGNGAYKWHTFYGSSDTDDLRRGVAVDKDSGSVYAAGHSKASWKGDGNANPLNAFKASPSSTDLFVIKFNDKGDINGDNHITLHDAILALQIVTGMEATGIRNDLTDSGAEVNGTGKLGIADPVFILQQVAETR